MENSNDNKLNQQGGNLENQGQKFSSIPPQSSNRNLKIIIGVVVVLLVGALGVAGYYVFVNKKGNSFKQNVIQKTQTNSTNEKEAEKIHLAYSDNDGHVIYDGRDMGEGDNIKISNNHIGFIRVVKAVPHFIYDGIDMGEVGDKTTDPRIYWSLFDISYDNYAFDKTVGNKNHTFYNGKDLGESECFKISGSDYAIAKKINNSYQLLYDGEIFGNLYNQNVKEVGMGSICYSFAIRDKNIFYLDSSSHLFRNKESLGQADYDIFRGYADNLNIPGLGEFSASNENYCFSYHKKGEVIKLSENSSFSEPNHIMYNGKDIGFGFGCRVSGSNIAYDDLNYHIIYNGKDLGEGIDVILKDKNIAFNKNVNGKNHIIYNGKDLGEGYLHFNQSGINENNVISDENIVFLRENSDHTTNIIYNGVDYGKGGFAQIAGNHIAFIKDDPYSLVLDGKNIENAASSYFVLSR